MDMDIAEEEVDGSIHSIHLRNFFCHENLEVNFNRNVNFIVGRNGSGKSAILTALIVGLGARASATSRGSNLHSFIRKGANSANVEIKIKNNSAKAYKHHLYGDYITIVRHIQASGGSSYKVKSATGEVISTKFEEVNAIIIAHDIQVDNPISVLNQDDARSFHASDAKKKYLLFRKATNLDLTETNYMRALENCEKATSIWNRKQEACKELAKDFKKWETAYEHLQSRDEMEHQNHQLQNEYYWSEVSELEEEAKKVQLQFDRHNLKINKLMEKLNSIEQNYGSNNETIETLKSQIEEKTLEQTVSRQEVSRLDEEARAAQAALQRARAAASKYQEQLGREKRKLQDLEREIQNIDSGSAATQRAALEAEAERAEEELASLSARISTAQHEATQARAHAARLAAAAEARQQASSGLRNNIRQLKQQLRELESRGDDSLAVYGARMVELCQRVKEATKRGLFSAEPRGPVGAALKVKEKKWGGALEHIIGGSLQTFCVNTAADSRQLLAIMNKVYGNQKKPSVYCSKFLSKVHDVRRNKVRARGFSTALDALDIADPVIANYLIDSVRIEGILLVADHEDAVRLSDNVENVPEKLSRIVTLDSSEYFPAPNYRSYGGAGRPCRYLALSTAERKKQLQAEIQEAESALSAAEEKAETAAAEAERARELERSAGRGVRGLLAQQHGAEGAARGARAALGAGGAPHHDVLVEEQEITNQKVASLKSKVEEAEAEQSGLRRRADELDGEAKRAKAGLARAGAALRALTEELDQEQLKLDQGVTERKMCASKLKEDKEKLKQVERILGEKRAVVEDKTEQALALCPRVENPREKSVVCNELKKTQLKLNAIRSDGLSKAEVAEKLLASEAKYSNIKQLLDRLRSLITEIQKTSDRHLKFCQQVQTYIARRVQHCFQAILMLRGYTGRMDIDHARGSLDLFCSGREAARAATSTTSLSGGERSYSTVAFIMSLWDCVELPFYFMDEFDVFMDNVNRKIVMDLLIDHALKNPSRQFVFLTPQDSSSITASDRIKIHRMVDPRR